MKEITTFIFGFFFFEAWGYNLTQAGCSLWQSVIIISAVNVAFVVFEAFFIKKIIDFALKLFVDSNNPVLVRTKNFFIEYRESKKTRQSVNKIERFYQESKKPFLKYLILAILTIIPGMQKFAVTLAMVFPIRLWLVWVSLCATVRIYLVLKYGPDFLYQLWALFF